jgi:hypothetical protein
MQTSVWLEAAVVRSKGKNFQYAFIRSFVWDLELLCIFRKRTVKFISRDSHSVILPQTSPSPTVILPQTSPSPTVQALTVGVNIN